MSSSIWITYSVHKQITLHQILKESHKIFRCKSISIRRYTASQLRALTWYYYVCILTVESPSLHRKKLRTFYQYLQFLHFGGQQSITHLIPFQCDELNMWIFNKNTTISKHIINQKEIFKIEKFYSRSSCHNTTHRQRSNKRVLLLRVQPQQKHSRSQSIERKQNIFLHFFPVSSVVHFANYFYFVCLSLHAFLSARRLQSQSQFSWTHKEITWL